MAGNETSVQSGGVTTPAGFTAGAVGAGIKNDRNDLALLWSEVPASIAGVFTTNRIQGATVKLCRERLRGGVARAVIINSGNANACTGPAGMQAARRMAEVTAKALSVDADQVFVCSTGVIGVPLPIDKIEAAIPRVVQGLSREGGAVAARAVMTTDTRPKECAVRISVDGQDLWIGGMAKGAGMIEPNMATMLAFLTTDAAVPAADLQQALMDAVGLSFNRISIDGDQSCNDTVLVMANGASRVALDCRHPAWPLFCRTLEAVCLDLALKIVADGEGVTKRVEVRVRGAASAADAEKAARAVANSLLVKTSWYGCDPNWGRVIDAVGYSGADVDEARVRIAYDEVVAVEGGMGFGLERLAQLEAVLRRDHFFVDIDLNLGDGVAVVYTCDCSVEYVRINADYTT